MPNPFARKGPYSDAHWYRPRTEASWHKHRKPDVTATSAAALFGVSPYMTPFDLFHRMAGTIEVIIEQSERMLWGKRLQNAIALGICEDNGWTIVDAHPFLYARSPRFKGMGASPDYIVTDAARPELGFGLLEIKNVDKFVGMDEWAADEAPVHIEFQLQHQLEACRLNWGAIGGLVGGNETKVFRRDYDPEVGSEIGKRVEAMHDRVKRNDPPAPDYLADYETIRTLYRIAAVGKAINLDVVEDAEADAKAAHIADLCAKKIAADAAFKNAEEDKKRAASELLMAIGDNESAFGRGFKISASTVNKAEQVVTFPATSYRMLRVSQPKSKGKKK